MIQTNIQIGQYKTCPTYKWNNRKHTQHTNGTVQNMFNIQMGQSKTGPTYKWDNTKHACIQTVKNNANFNGQYKKCVYTRCAFESCEQYCWGRGNEQIMVQLLKLVNDNILILVETWGVGWVNDFPETENGHGCLN